MAAEHRSSQNQVRKEDSSTVPTDRGAACTIGIIANRQIYSGATIDRYEQALLRGIRAAATAHGCNLLMACGVGPSDVPFTARPAWPAAQPDADFVPVGPWNTGGLIAVPPFSAAQLDALQELLPPGYPCVFTYPQGGYPSVAPDNRSGIQQAFAHLVAHGHRRIAFIADAEDAQGDGAERLAAYREALAAHGIPFEESLIGYGQHDTHASYQTMQRMLASGLEFTAMLASNDESAIGAMRALAEAGKSVPRDVAVIGFDDVLYARVQSPPLTTVRHPTFDLGYRAVELLLNYLEGHRHESATVRVPIHLIVRESCGCGPSLASEQSAEKAVLRGGGATPPGLDALTPAIANAASVELAQSNAGSAVEWARSLIVAFATGVERRDGQPFASALEKLLDTLEAANEDLYPVHTAISILGRHSETLLSSRADADSVAWADELIDRARLRAVERVQRQHTRSRLRQAELSDRLGAMTSRLLLALDAREILDILAEHLPGIGIRSAQVGLFEAEGDDPVAWTRLYVRSAAGEPSMRRFRSREFPPPDLYPATGPYSLALLPLIIEEGPCGFVAFEGDDLEQYALIVRHLAAAFRSARLRSAAEEGRRLAEDANRLKSRFLSTVSHELRTPLNIILGLSEMVLDQSRSEPSALPAIMREDLERIHANAQHLGRLIGDVLDLASSEAGQLRLYVEPLDLSDALAVVVETGAQLAKEKGLDWQANLPSPGPWVVGDRTRLRQVALNLISNAIKFTDHGGIVVELSTAESEARFSVTDSGAGVPLAEQERIFDEFRSSERTAGRGYGGLGLGLTISRQLIGRHGGAIAVHSSGEEGSGATFFFTLPVISGAGMPSTADSVSTDRRVVLLTEGQRSTDQLLNGLAGRGFEVQIERMDHATNLLPRLVASPPSAVLLDEAMARQRGWEILALLKRHPSTAQLPVLMYSLEPGQERGALVELDYMMKPLAPEQLAQVLEQREQDTEPGGAATIMVVDDDPDIRRLHTRLIREQLPRAQVLEARNGREALALMEQVRPSLVLLDLMMPEVDGFGVLEGMRSREATRDVPVVVLTSQILTDEDIDRLNAGVSAILSKGLFSGQEILEHVQATLEHRRKLGSAMQQVVRRAIAYIHEHYGKGITREQIAEHLNVNPDYLTASFRQEMGVTPIAYLNRYRITRARTLLEETDRSITEIALSVGFSDLPSFSRLFHRETGVSPNAYRRQKERKG